MRTPKETLYKDRRDKTIRTYDIVMCDNEVGWVFEYDGDFFVAWDVIGPSCEDCKPISEILADKYCSVYVIGTINL